MEETKPNPDGLVEVALPSGELVRVDPLRASWYAEQAAKGKATSRTAPAVPVVVEPIEEEPPHV